MVPCIVIYIIINQQDAAVCSQFYFTAGSLYLTVWPVPEAVDTVLCTPDDGCGKHPEHVEWPCSEIKLTANCCFWLIFFIILIETFFSPHQRTLLKLNMNDDGCLCSGTKAGLWACVIILLIARATEFCRGADAATGKPRPLSPFHHIKLQARRVLYIGQTFRYSPENAFYIFNQQIYFIIWYLLDRASLI